MRAILLGYGERIGSTMDGEKLFLEARELQGLFNPYAKSMDRSLKFVHSDSEIVKMMEAHFLDRGHMWNLGIELGFVHRLMHLIGYMHESNTFFGRSFCEVVWDTVKLRGDRSLILPVELNFLPTETVRKKMNGKYVQRYSLLTRMKIFGPYIYKTAHFEKDEIFMLEWPFGTNSVWSRVRYIYKNKFKFMQFGLAQAEATSSANTTSYRLLRASRSSYGARKADNQITELRIRRAMRIGAYTDGFSPTKFYDSYLLYCYLFDKSHALRVYIDAFNEQIMSNLAKKNGWDEVPLLTYTGKYPEKAVTNLWNRYKQKDITYEEFIDQVSDKD